MTGVICCAYMCENRATPKKEKHGAAIAMTRTIFLVAIVLCVASIALARDAREQARIDFLLHTVETSAGVVFIRNGSEYDGHSAAQHLRRKLNYAGERIQTAEQFIQYCASESSMTHRKYSVRLADGTTVDSATYFAGLLREWDQQKH